MNVETVATWLLTFLFGEEKLYVHPQTSYFMESIESLFPPTFSILTFVPETFVSFCTKASFRKRYFDKAECGGGVNLVFCWGHINIFFVDFKYDMLPFEIKKKILLEWWECN